MSTARPLAALLGAWALLLPCACGADGRREMSGAEIEELFTDHTVHGHHDKRGYDFASYYEPLPADGGRGTFRSYQGGAEQPRQGTWWVAGNHICIRWEDGGGVYERTMLTDDEGRYWKVLVKPSGKRIPIVTFESFARGNVEDR